jgi:hypothetical protein
MKLVKKKGQERNERKKASLIENRINKRKERSGCVSWE